MVGIAKGCDVADDCDVSAKLYGAFDDAPATNVCELANARVP